MLRVSALVTITLLMPALCAPADTGEHARAGTTNAVPGAAVLVVDSKATAVVIRRDGRRYLVDLAAKSVRELDPDPPPSEAGATTGSSSPATSQEAPRQQASSAPPAASGMPYYVPGDERLFGLPTGQRLHRHGVAVNFTHRFVYSPAFKGVARGHILAGLDDIAVASFGFKYGLTSRLAVSAFRSPSLLGRPIELMASYQVAEERNGAPLNAMLRFSVDGQNDFTRNFTTNFEAILSRSLTNRAALYLVPTLSIHNRPLLGTSTAVTSPPPYQPCGQALANGIPASLKVQPCANTFSLGVGLAVDVRPTVAIVAEVIPTIANGTEIGIHRPPFAFGIQKKIFRHAFTFGFTTGPGSTVSQRAGTRATYLRNPNADTPSGLFMGFNLSRQLR